MMSIAGFKHQILFLKYSRDNTNNIVGTYGLYLLWHCSQMIVIINNNILKPSYISKIKNF